MPDKEQSPEEQKWHKTSAVNLFNRVWELMEKEDRSAEGTDEMIHAAHASVYHWSQVGTAQNIAVGEWQVSRMYTVLNRPEPALAHIRRCLEITEAENVTGFYLASAYEGLARASAVAGNAAD